MSASEHEVIRDLLADLLNEQRATTAAISSLAVAIAGTANPAAKAQADAVIEKAAAPAPKPPKAAAAASATPKAPTAPAEPPAASPSEPATAPADATVTYDDVAALVIKYSKTNGRPAAVELLKQFGITSLTAAKPEQFAAIAGAFAIETEAV
jgi:hypothetical protein